MRWGEVELLPLQCSITVLGQQVTLTDIMETSHQSIFIFSHQPQHGHHPSAVWSDHRRVWVAGSLLCDGEPVCVVVCLLVLLHVQLPTPTPQVYAVHISYSVKLLHLLHFNGKLTLSNSFVEVLSVSCVLRNWTPWWWCWDEKLENEDTWRSSIGNGWWCGTYQFA